MRRGAAALKRLCVAPEPPPTGDFFDGGDYDDEHAAWLDTWPGFMQRVTDAENDMLLGVLQAELRFSDVQMDFSLRQALRGMLAAGLFRYCHQWPRTPSAAFAAGGALAEIGARSDSEEEEEEEAQEVVVLEEDDQLLEAFAS
jgi:hypothetical protein